MRFDKMEMTVLSHAIWEQWDLFTVSFLIPNPTVSQHVKIC